MAEIRKIEIDREFIVKLKGKVSTKELAEIFDNLHEAIKEVICNNIVDDGVVSVEPVKRGEWASDDVPMCSECGYIPPDDNDDIFYSNFCGAKMDEVTK